MLTYKIVRTRHNGKETATFSLNRPHGTDDYLLLHFKTPVIFNMLGEAHKVTPGMCIVISPRTPYSFRADGVALVHDWMHFLPSDEKEFLNLKIDINHFFSPIETDFITAFTKRCEGELIYKDENYLELVSAEVACMMIRLGRASRTEASTNYADALRALRLDIYRHPSHYQDTELMYKKIGISRSRFSVLYKEMFGIPPKQDLINSRVAKAAYLLSLGNDTLTEISELCGYSNIYHFIRQFRTSTGMTPAVYRKSRV